MNLPSFGLEHSFQAQTFFLHPKAYKAFLKFQKEGKDQNLDIQVASGFRSFERQRDIWNAKASGSRVLLDSQSKEIDFNKLTPIELIHSILRWSALPGFSRHHWGSDFDIIDQKALKDNPSYQVKLIPSEYQKGGIFEELGNFLNESLDSSPFYRPYERDLGGVAPEPWHLSFKPLADEFFQSFEASIEFIQSDYYQDILLKELIIENFEEIYGRYISLTL